MEVETTTKRCCGNWSNKEKKIVFMFTLVIRYHLNANCIMELSSKGNFSYFFVEIFVGFMYKSLALVADACHMLSDGLCLVIAFIAIQGKLSSNTMELLDRKIFQFQNDHQINVF